MPTEQQIRERVESEGNLANRFASRVATPILTTRPNNAKKRLPEFIKNTVAVMAQMETGTQECIGAEFDVTQQAVSLIHTGETHSNKNEVDKRLGIIKDIAMNKLIGVLGLLDEDKLSEARPRELSKIANDLSGVIQKATPQDRSTSTGVGVSISIYTPQLKSEEEYVTHEVSTVD